MVDRLAEYFFDSRADIIQLDLLEITHPNFSQPYRVVRNKAAGVVVDLALDELAVPFQYYPLQVSTIDSTDDLSSTLQVQLGDLGEVIPGELDLLTEWNGFLIKPTVRYWTYRSDDLTQPLLGPVRLEVPGIEMQDQGSAFEARAPELNMNRTGERYKLERWPMLRGFLL
jgi:hypothetical protein